MDKATFISRYGLAVDEQRATVLVGAGLSLGAGYPDWAGLLVADFDSCSSTSTV